MENVAFRWFLGTEPLFETAKAVRQKVFVEEQGFSLTGEFDEKDRECLHVLAFLEGRAVGTARLFSEEPKEIHVGRVAVLSDCRGKGVGLALMDEVYRKAKELGMETILLNAQQTRAGFYKRAGYRLTGGQSQDEGCPHVEMMCAVRKQG